MRFKVDMNEQVVRYLRLQCDKRERLAFADAMERVRQAPLANSEPAFDPKQSPYMARYFRFGANIALFQFDRARQKIRVLECQKRKRHPERKRPDQPP